MKHRKLKRLKLIVNLRPDQVQRLDHRDQHKLSKSFAPIQHQIKKEATGAVEKSNYQPRATRKETMPRTSYGVGLVLVSVLLAAAYSADIHPLQDGMLITGRNLLKIQTAEWTVLVTLERPRLNVSIQDQYDAVVPTILKPSLHDYTPLRERKEWLR